MPGSFFCVCFVKHLDVLVRQLGCLFEMSINSTLGVSLNWFHLLGTLGLAKDLLVPSTPPIPNFCPPPSTATSPHHHHHHPPRTSQPLQPRRSQECRRVSASVWDLARQKLRVTSTPSHFEMDPWWQLLGEPSDVSISLSKEIARGSTRSP